MGRSLAEHRSAGKVGFPWDASAVCREGRLRVGRRRRLGGRWLKTGNRGWAAVRGTAAAHGWAAVRGTTASCGFSGEMRRSEDSGSDCRAAVPV